MGSICFNIFRLKRKLITFKIKNYILKKDVEAYLAYNYLYKNYKNIIDESNYKKTNSKFKKVIWFCWFQGIENAPKLVQSCFNKIKKVFKDYEIVLLTSDNYNKYVEIPEYIIKKWEKGIISNTHFSDILRIELLAKHGGIWIDSTVYPTCKDVPNYIEDNGMFLYKDIDLNRNDKSIIVASSWFLKTNAQDPIILLTRDLLREYWKENNKIIDYFLLHLFFSMSTKKYVDYWESISNYNNVNPHIMQFELHKKYDKERFEYFKSLSDFHKLSYKFDFSKFEKNSNYDYIVGDLNE